jgi:hypothetical protein
MAIGETDRCPGSRTFVEFEPDAPRPKLACLVGVCPVCGRRLALGYAGLLPDHEPAAREQPASA